MRSVDRPFLPPPPCACSALAWQSRRSLVWHNSLERQPLCHTCDDAKGQDAAASRRRAANGGGAAAHDAQIF
eukprot:2647429-Pleurochrysis_carterae.AAC.3